jgi:hypothetical protein
MDQRTILSYCDLLLGEIIENTRVRRDIAPFIDIRDFWEKINAPFPINGALRRLAEDRYIELLPDRWTKSTLRGEDFFRTSGYVKEFDREYKMKWYEEEEAERAFKDYPSTKRKANWAIYLSAGLIILEIMKLLRG